MNNQKIYQPEPIFCNNKWCKNNEQVYSTERVHEIDNCSSLQSMVIERNTTGGITGRGVIPCPFGYYQNNGNYTPISSNLSELFFKPDQPGWIPQQANPRTLIRIGNTYRNSN
jgi:hypothetical protein